MFEILVERGAEKDLRRLSNPIHDRIIRAMSALAKNPRPPGCRKLSGGDYRVIYQIADADQTVRVNRVRHRREVYC